MLDGKLFQSLEPRSWSPEQSREAAASQSLGAGAPACGEASGDGRSSLDLTGRDDALGPFEPDYAISRDDLAAGVEIVSDLLDALVGALWIGITTLSFAALWWKALILPALCCALFLIPLHRLESLLFRLRLEAVRRRAE